MLLFFFSLILPLSNCQLGDQDNTQLTIPDQNADLPPFEDIQLIRNYSFTKCFCDPLQGWNGTHCVDLEIKTIRDILDRLELGVQNPLDNYLSSVEVYGNLCVSNQKEYAVNEGSFYLTYSGDLYHKDSDMLFYEDQFCLEFIDQANISIIQAYVCVPTPRVSVCCSDEEACDATALQDVPILFGGSPIQWEAFDTVSRLSLDCNEGEILKEININQTNNSLTFHYVAEEVRPLWTSPPPINEGHFFPINSYCLFTNNNSTPSMTSGQFCYFDQVENHLKKCSSSVCVRKCCPEGHIYDSSHKSCIPADLKDQWKIKYFDSRTKRPTNPPSDVIIEHSFPWCEPQRPYLLDPTVNPGDDFILLDNGSMHIILSDIAMPPSKYCIDSFTNEDGAYTAKAISCFLEEPQEQPDKCREIHKRLSPAFIIVSCIFLAITLFVYIAVPELHSKLHGKSLLSHVTSLLVAYLCQLIVSWSSRSLNMTGCKIVALFNQISFLWAFFWLNVMCFDIWWTLKSMSPSPETGENTRKRFALYSMYAWGCPLVIGLITALLEFLPSPVDRAKYVLPGFGVRGCWFQDQKSTWIYFHGFTLTLYILNILFFIHVAAILIMGQRSTQGILRTTRKQHLERVFLYLRLFAVMGISWICEVISWQEGTCEIWIFPDIINSCQGVFIFFIFMCNRKVLEKVKAKWLPIVQRLKALVLKPSGGPVARRKPLNILPQGTQQTSLASSSRRLSSSSLQQCETMQVPLNTLVAKKEVSNDLEKDSSSAC